MPQPARKRRQRRIGVARIDIDKGGCARATVEVFIRAAHGKIGVAACQIDLRGAGGMGQIPHGDHPHIMGAAGQGAHVMHAPSAVIDLGQQGNGHLGGEVGCHVFGGDNAQFVALAQRRNQPLRHVKIGRKIAVVR